MDLDADGHLDVLSGSYSRMESGMAGLFQVLRGQEGGGFAKAEALTGTDGEPLILPGDDDDNVVERICTRPFAVDHDGDGDLDIVSGNFRGTFYLFEGSGDGNFAPTATQLEAEGEPLSVPAHSDPFFFDWDADGDLDLVSGSTQGVHLALNVGSRTEPKYAKPKVLLEAAGYGGGADLVLGDGGYTKPGHSLRVWVDDVNGDGRFDLLIGDGVTLNFPAEGVDEATCRERHAEWQAEMQRINEAYSEIAMNEELTAEQEEARDAILEELRAHYDEQEEFLDSRMTGYVWVAYQVAEPGS